MSKQTELEDVNDALLATFKYEASKDMSCIVYVFDKSEGGGGTGFNTINCDLGDALVAVKRISEQFGIEIEELKELLEE